MSHLEVAEEKRDSRRKKNGFGSKWIKATQWHAWYTVCNVKQDELWWIICNKRMTKAILLKRVVVV